MNPVKFREMIDPAAARTGESGADVKNIWGFYWETMRRVLPQLPALRVRVVGLGTFDIKHWLLERKRSGLLKIIAVSPTPANLEQLERLSLLQGLQEEAVQKKEDVRRSRNK